MSTVRFIDWQEDDAWLGYLEDFPDYRTQGETLDDLKEHLKDLYDELTSGRIPGVRRVGEPQAWGESLRAAASASAYPPVEVFEDLDRIVAERRKWPPRAIPG